MDERQIDLAAHWLGVGRPEKALEALDAAGDAGWWHGGLELRGRALVALKRYEEAAHVAAAGLEDAPDPVGLLDLLGDARHAGGDLAGAEEAYLAGLHLEPDNVSLLCRYARVLAGAAQLGKAEQVLERAAVLAPDSEEVQAARAVVHWVQGRDREVASGARSLLSLEPEDEAGHALSGLAAVSTARYRTARRHFGQLAASDPGDAHAAAIARELRVMSHPLLLPLRVAERWSPGAVWIAFMVAVAALLLLGWREVAVVVAVLYLLVAVWSWIAPPLVRRWLRARRL